MANSQDFFNNPIHQKPTTTATNSYFRDESQVKQNDLTSKHRESGIECKNKNQDTLTIIFYRLTVKK